MVLARCPACGIANWGVQIAAFLACGGALVDLAHDELVLHIAPDKGVSLQFCAKLSAQRMTLGSRELLRYEAGSLGAREADALIQRDGRAWRQMLLQPPDPASV